MEDGAQSEEPADAGCRGQGRILGAQVGHPSEDMRIAAELFKTSNLRVFGSEIDEETAHHDVVVAFAGRSECGAQGLDRMGEDRSQGNAGVEDGASASGDPRLRMDALCGRAGELEIDILR